MTRHAIFKIISVIFAILLFTTTGFFIGFRQGIETFTTLDSTNKGRLALGYISAIKKGQTEVPLTIFENDVDMALDGYSKLNEQWRSYLFKNNWLPIKPDNYDDYIKKIATYRKYNPQSSFIAENSWPNNDSTLSINEKSKINKKLKEFHDRVNKAVEKNAR